MTKWLATVVFIATLMISTINAVQATSAGVQKVRSSTMTDVSARRHDRHNYRHDAYRPYYPYYYGRPTYYSPGPILPLPPFFGYGWESW
jgi:hypothetical protein